MTRHTTLWLATTPLNCHTAESHKAMHQPIWLNHILLLFHCVFQLFNWWRCFGWNECMDGVIYWNNSTVSIGPKQRFMSIQPNSLLDLWRDDFRLIPNIHLNNVWFSSLDLVDQSTCEETLGGLGLSWLMYWNPTKAHMKPLTYFNLNFYTFEESSHDLLDQPMGLRSRCIYFIRC